MGISIQYAKKALEDTRMTHIVIFGVSADGMQHVATFGKTKQCAREAAKAGNNLKAALKWEQAPASPLPRICKNCDFYKPDFGTFCFNGWSGNGSDGYCLSAPERVRVEGGRRACLNWEPKS
jgi:hypothetical protein